MFSPSSTAILAGEDGQNMGLCTVGAFNPGTQTYEVSIGGESMSARPDQLSPQYLVASASSIGSGYVFRYIPSFKKGDMSLLTCPAWRVDISDANIDPRNMNVAYSSKMDDVGNLVHVFDVRFRAAATRTDIVLGISPSAGKSYVDRSAGLLV